MSHITIDTLNRSWHFGFGTGRVKALHLDIQERYRRWQQSRIIAAELRQYAPNEIVELGITRADIDRIADDAAGR